MGSNREVERAQRPLNSVSSSRKTGDPLMNRRHLWSWSSVRLLLVLLLLAAFAPLLAGRNFLPFQRYSNWGRSAVEASGRSLEPDEAFWSRKSAAPWVTDMDFVALSIFWPQDAYVARSLRAGRIPLWDPYTGCGIPTLDNGQFRPFDPVRWLFYLHPSSWSYCLTLLIELLFGAIGALWWFQTEGYGKAEALLGAAVLVLNPWVLDRSGICILDVATYAYFPWALLGLRQARWGHLRSLALAVLPFVFMGQAGNPEPCLLASGMAGAYHLFAGLGESDERWAKLAQRARVLMAVGLLSAAALAVLWVPLVKMSALSFSYKKAGVAFLFEYSWKALFAMASDLFLVPALVAVILSAVASRRKGTGVWYAVIAVSLLALMPLGHAGTLLKAGFQKHIFNVPLFYFKGSLWAGISFLLPAGLEAFKKGNRILRWGALAVAVAWVGGILNLATHLSLPLAQQTTHVVAALALMAAGLVALALWAGVGRSMRAFEPVLVCLVVLPLVFPLALDHMPWNKINPKAGETVRWLHNKHSHERVVSIGWRPSFVLPPNQGQVFGVRSVEDNGAYFLNNYFQLFFVPPAPPTCIMFRNLQWRRFEQMGAKFVLVPEESPISGMAPVWRGKNALVYQVPGGWGRLYWARAAVARNSGLNLARQILDLGRGADGVAVVEAMGQPTPAVWPTIPAGKGRLTFIRDDARQVVVRSNAPKAGLLILRDSWYPGWRAFVDGKITPIYRVNGCFRGVVVPEGKHVVRFVYRPLLVYASGIVSLLTTLFLFLMILIRRKEPVDAGPSPVGT